MASSCTTRNAGASASIVLGRSMCGGLLVSKLNSSRSTPGVTYTSTSARCHASSPIDRPPCLDENRTDPSVVHAARRECHLFLAPSVSKTLAARFELPKYGDSSTRPSNLSATRRQASAAMEPFDVEMEQLRHLRILLLWRRPLLRQCRQFRPTAVERGLDTTHGRVKKFCDFFERVIKNVLQKTHRRVPWEGESIRGARLPGQEPGRED
jgi:hypothetical protein